eukprot:917563-Amphidinium_carterae.1
MINTRDLLATLGGERGLRLTFESCTMRVVQGSVRASVAASTRMSAIGQTIFTEGLTYSAYAIAAVTACRGCIVHFADRTEDPEVAVVIPSKSSPDAVSMQSSFAGYGRLVGAAAGLRVKIRTSVGLADLDPTELR